MNYIPTWIELKEFLKAYKKVILTTFAIVLFLFLLLTAYNTYAINQDDTVEEPELTPQEVNEIIGMDPEEVQANELQLIEDTLSYRRYAVPIHIERGVTQEVFNDTNVLNEILVQENVINEVEERSGVQIIPEQSPELAIRVGNREGLTTVMVGLGSEEENKAVAQAYMDLLESNSEIIDFLEDKEVYHLASEPELIREETWAEIVQSNVQFLSPGRLIIFTIIISVTGLIMGVVIAIVQAIIGKPIPFLYGLEMEETDKVIPFNKLGKSEKELEKRISHVILTHPEYKKLVLSTEPISPELEKILLSNGNIEIVASLEESSISKEVEEVFILVKQNRTLKDWYKDQRIQLKRLNALINIIQY